MSLAVLLVTSKSPRVTFLTRAWVERLTRHAMVYADEQSGGRAKLDWQVFDWVRLPLTDKELLAAGWNLAEIAVPEVSKQLDVDLSSYSHFALVIDQWDSHLGAWASDGRPYLHLSAQDLTPALYAHELGHYFKAQHAYSMGPTGVPVEYGDGFCVMGGEGSKASFLDPANNFRDRFGQPYWRHCELCGGLYYNGNEEKGRCPAAASPTTGHQPTGGRDFVLPYTEDHIGQHDWFYCPKCFLLAYGRETGTCPAGGSHDARGHNYVIPYDVPPSPPPGPGQPGWRYCQKCHALVFEDPAGPSACAAGGGHDPGGYNYSLPNNIRGHNDTGPGMTAPTLIDCGWLDLERNGINVSGLATRPSNANAELGVLRGAPPADSGRRVVAWADGLHQHRVYVEYRARDGRWDQGLADALPNFPRWILVHLARAEGASGPVLVRAFPAELNGNAFVQEAGLKVTVTARDDDSDVITLRLDSLVPLGPNVQGNWGFCRFCLALFHDGYHAKGSCRDNAAGHAAYGYEYVLTHGTEPDGAQPGWRFCDNCRALFYAGTPGTKGVCPAGGAHVVNSSFAYVVFHADDYPGQNKWRFCDNCFVLYYDGNPAKKGHCPATGNGHHPEGYDYRLATL